MLNPGKMLVACEETKCETKLENSELIHPAFLRVWDRGSWPSTH